MARNEGQSAPHIAGVKFRKIMRPRLTALTKECKIDPIHMSEYILHFMPFISSYFEY
jgi:hypothetical protein